MEGTTRWLPQMTKPLTKWLPELTFNHTFNPYAMVAAAATFFKNLHSPTWLQFIHFLKTLSGQQERCQPSPWHPQAMLGIPDVGIYTK